MKVTLTAALGAALLLAPSAASAQDDKIDGVRAVDKHGTLQVKGGDQDNSVTLRLAADNPQVVQVDVGADGTPQFSFARTSIAAIDLKGGAGDDVLKIDDANGAFTDTTPTTISGGDGNDSLEGGQTKVATENEHYRGGAGSDLVDGGKGTDTASLGSGDDTFRWDNGEGSDVVEGDDGYDTLVFNGAGINEQATLSANDGRLSFFRTQGNVLMDTDGVERVDDNAAGGADSFTVDDLSSTDVRQTNLDLGGTDGALDSVLVNATEGDDNVAIDGFPTRVDVSGLANLVSIRRAEPTDALAVDTRAGTDHVVTNNIAGLLQVAVDGVAV